MISKTIAYLSQPIAASPLITFRVVMGGMLFFSTLRFMYLGWIEDHFATVFQFKYYGFYWIPNLPTAWLYGLHVLMAVSALGVMARIWYRFSAIFLFVSFTYIELIDLTYYLNHYYFVSLVLLLLAVLPAPKNLHDTVPRWVLWLFKVQVGIVYFYAGIAKINYDWLICALPLKIWLPAQDKLPLVGELFTYKVVPYLFSWAGMLYDCLVPFLLAYHKTRLPAYLAVIVFHTLTGLMFQIGIFPLVMIGATLIFFSENWHYTLWYNVNTKLNNVNTKLNNVNTKLNNVNTKLNNVNTKLNNVNTKLNNVKANLNNVNAKSNNVNTKGFIFILLLFYLIFQLFFPLRYLSYEGNLFWTEEGYRFSWRVMLMEKAGTATFYVRDTRTGKEGVVDNREFLNAHQEKQMAMQPDMILQFAHFLGAHYAGKGVYRPQVRAEVYVTLNGRPSRLLLHPQINLMTLQDSWAGKTWLIWD
jgi:hypothetical protein